MWFCFSFCLPFLWSFWKPLCLAAHYSPWPECLNNIVLLQSLNPWSVRPVLTNSVLTPILLLTPGHLIFLKKLGVGGEESYWIRLLGRPYRITTDWVAYVCNVLSLALKAGNPELRCLQADAFWALWEASLTVAWNTVLSLLMAIILHGSTLSSLDVSASNVPFFRRTPVLLDESLP